MVIIKDFKMPESCSDCPICYDQMECPISGLRFWRGRPENSEFKFTEERHQKCPLIEVPTSAVRPVVRGKWIWDDFGYHCSECYYHVYGSTGEVLTGEYKFCPHCGAEMEGDTE